MTDSTARIAPKALVAEADDVNGAVAMTPLQEGRAAIAGACKTIRQLGECVVVEQAPIGIFASERRSPVCHA